MKQTGLSIRCPHCLEWSNWPNIDPADIVVWDDAEWAGILREMKRDPDAFRHDKMLSCQDPGGQCPARFQSFLCANPQNAHRYVRDVPTWMLRRAFRPFRDPSGSSRWDEYGALVFSNMPVTRRKHIELEQLLDRELLSRAILGMRYELDAPITVYAATAFEMASTRRIVWIPVEGYRKGVPHAPSEYNPLCDLCRTASVESLLKRFQGRATPSDCPARLGADGKCAGREAACLRDDWDHCPAFLDARYSLKMCYYSDCSLIKQVEVKWLRGTDDDHSSEPHPPHTCWAGLREAAVPIIVHDHLIGVAMTGQFVVGDATLPDAEAILADKPFLESRSGEIKALCARFRSRKEALTDDQGRINRFFLTEDQFKEKSAALWRNAQRIAMVAEARYRDCRSRFEAVFRQELVGRLENAKASPARFNDSVPGIIERMREFWTFLGVYLLACDVDSGKLSVVAASTKDSAPRYFPHYRKSLGTITVDLSQVHPAPWLYDSKSEIEPTDSWISEHRKLFAAALTDPDLAVPINRYYFFVLVPFVNKIYSFVFAVRDESDVSPLRSRNKGSISGLCQEAILETGTEIIRKLGEFWEREDRERVQAEIWRKVSARAAHTINNELFVARGALRRLLPHFKGKPAEGTKEVTSAIERIGRICKVLTAFGTDQSVHLDAVDPRRLILDVVRRYRKMIHGQQLKHHLPRKLPECQWDAVEIDHILSELLRNAVHHTPAGHTIEVSAEPSNKDGRDALRIVVTNTGSSVPRDLKAKIFLPFFTTRAEGVGLGLAIVDNFVKNHAGTITEIGTPGKNTMFVIELPVDPRQRRTSCERS